MQNKKPSFIVLILSLALSVAHLVLLFLGVFGVLVPSWLIESNFNYLLAFCLLALNLILDIVFLVIEKHKLLEIPEWFRVVFFIGFFIFTNVYYYFGLYNLIYTVIILYVYLAVVLSIASISIFYNVQKDDRNIVKSNNKFACVSTFTYSTSMFLIIETAVIAVKIIFGMNTASTSTMFLINSCVAILVSLVISIIFYLSLSRTKRLVNACLIKLKNEPKKETMEETK